jgi:hypothetical protein
MPGGMPEPNFRRTQETKDVNIHPGLPGLLSSFSLSLSLSLSQQDKSHFKRACAVLSKC